MPIANIEVTISEMIRVDDHQRIVKFTAGADELPSFEAGQFIRVGALLDEKEVFRPYSLVNPPGTDYFEIYYMLLDDGLLTVHLENLQVGDKLLVKSKPNGFLILSEVPAAKQLWLVASGTGLGPFISILQAGKIWENYEQVGLIHSVSVASNLAYIEQIESVLAKYPDRFCYLPHVTKEQCSYPNACTNRLTNTFKEGIWQSHMQAEITPANSQFMICGNPQMVKDFSTMLLELGYARNRRSAPGNISVENYW